MSRVRETLYIQLGNLFIYPLWWSIGGGSFGPFCWSDWGYALNVGTIKMSIGRLQIYPFLWALLADPIWVGPFTTA